MDVVVYDFDRSMIVVTFLREIFIHYTKNFLGFKKECGEEACN